jgi:hypothetical protein
MPHKALWVNHDATQEVKYIEGGYKPSEGELLLKCICVGVNPGDYTWVPLSHCSNKLRHPENFGAVDTVEGFDAVGMDQFPFPVNCRGNHGSWARSDRLQIWSESDNIC